MQVHTVFGSITDYTKGTIELVSGEARHYVFSNIFEVAAKSRPYERVVVARNMEYVQEVMRADGVSPWFACGHDDHIMATFKAMLRDWVNEGFDPFAAPVETGTAYGPKQGDNIAAIERTRIATRRMPGLPGDSPLRDDMAVNRAFADVPQDEPEIHAEPGFEGQLHAFSLFKYLSRSDVTWNPSVTAVCKASLACPTTEEFILPVFHGNDRGEWFIQLSDEIVWDVGDKDTGAPRARVTMKAGDVAAMPADIRHQGYSTKRSMLYVWENVTAGLPQRYESGELSPYPVDF